MNVWTILLVLGVLNNPLIAAEALPSTGLIVFIAAPERDHGTWTVFSTPSRLETPLEGSTLYGSVCWMADSLKGSISFSLSGETSRVLYSADVNFEWNQQAQTETRYLFAELARVLRHRSTQLRLVPLLEARPDNQLRSLGGLVSGGNRSHVELSPATPHSDQEWMRFGSEIILAAQKIGGAKSSAPPIAAGVEEIWSEALPISLAAVVPLKLAVYAPDVGFVAYSWRSPDVTAPEDLARFIRDLLSPQQGDIGVIVK